MLINSMNDLQKWDNKSVGDNIRAMEKKRLLGSAKAHLTRLGISSYLIPLLVEDMSKRIDIYNSDSYQELWKNYDELNISMKQFGSLLMHMTMLDVEKLLISKTKMLVNRRKTDENDLWHELTKSINSTLLTVEEASLD